jgi:hypothetical protein
VDTQKEGKANQSKVLIHLKEETPRPTVVLAKDWLNVDNISSIYPSSSAERSLFSFWSLSCAVENHWLEVRAEYH